MHAQAGDSNYLVNKDLNFIYKRQTISCVRANFFSERVINCWNSLPHIDFSFFSKFKRSVKRVDFTDFLRY